MCPLFNAIFLVSIMVSANIIVSIRFRAIIPVSMRFTAIVQVSNGFKAIFPTGSELSELELGTQAIIMLSATILISIRSWAIIAVSIKVKDINPASNVLRTTIPLSIRFSAIVSVSRARNIGEKVLVISIVSICSAFV